MALPTLKTTWSLFDSFNIPVPHSLRRLEQRMGRMAARAESHKNDQRKLRKVQDRSTKSKFL